MLLDTRSFRDCLSRFGTGVTVVTLNGPEGPRGLTVNAFTSVSLDPPLVLVSIAKKARTHDLLPGAAFTVNVLSTEQEEIARHFAGEPRPDLAVPWAQGGGAPRLEGSLAWMECRPWRDYDGGDHTLYVGEVAEFGHRSGDALAYYCSRFVPLPQPIPSQPVSPYDPFEMPYDAL